MGSRTYRPCSQPVNATAVVIQLDPEAEVLRGSDFRSGTAAAC
jgi:hypothetical protein